MNSMAPNNPLRALAFLQIRSRTESALVLIPNSPKSQREANKYSREKIVSSRQKLIGTNYFVGSAGSAELEHQAPFLPLIL